MVGEILKFDFLTVIEDVGTKKRAGRFDRYWRCRCRCGREREFLATRVRSGRTRSCGCHRNGHPKLKSGEAMANHWYNGYQQNARKRSIPFELTREQFCELTSSPCCYCGQPPSKTIRVRYGRNSKEKPGQFRSQSAYIANGVDRVDPKKGYVVANCAPCCSVCNHMKKAHSVAFFLEHVSKIYTANKAAIERSVQ